MLYKSILLNSHKDYIKLLNKLKENIFYLEIILNDESDLRILELFKDNIIFVKKVNSWWGLQNKHFFKTKLFRLKMDNKLYNFFCTFDTFGYIENVGIESNKNFSNFGKNDVAFLDKQENVILRTDIKNGYIDISFNFFK